LSLEWKSEGVMDDESGESMERMEDMPLKEMGEAEIEISAWLTKGDRENESKVISCRKFHTFQIINTVSISTISHL